MNQPIHIKTAGKENEPPSRAARAIDDGICSRRSPYRTNSGL